MLSHGRDIGNQDFSFSRFSLGLGLGSGIFQMRGELRPTDDPDVLLWGA